MGNTSSVSKEDTDLFKLVDQFLLDYAWDRKTLEEFYNDESSSIPLNEIKKGLENILKIQEYMLNYYTDIKLVQKQNLQKIKTNIKRLNDKIKDLDIKNNNKTKRAKEALEFYHKYYVNMFNKKNELEEKYINMVSNVNF